MGNPIPNKLGLKRHSLSVNCFRYKEPDQKNKANKKARLTTNELSKIKGILILHLLKDRVHQTLFVIETLFH